MAAVATVALGLGAWTWCARRSAHFRELAERHHQLSWESKSWYPRSCLINETERSSYHAEMCRKYKQASASPWLPVAEDPPAPEWPQSISKPRLPAPPFDRPESRLSQWGIGATGKNLKAKTMKGE
jgi:hypothetical protein